MFYHADFYARPHDVFTLVLHLLCTILKALSPKARKFDSMKISLKKSVLLRFLLRETVSRRARNFHSRVLQNSDTCQKLIWGLKADDFPISKLRPRITQKFPKMPFSTAITLFENYSKCRIGIFQFLSLKTDLSGNTVLPPDSGFPRLAKIDQFRQF